MSVFELEVSSEVDMGVRWLMQYLSFCLCFFPPFNKQVVLKKLKSGTNFTEEQGFPLFSTLLVFSSHFCCEIQSVALALPP